MLQDHLASNLKSFTWDVLLLELYASAPLLMSVLLGCTCTKRPRKSGMCVVLLLKNCRNKMSLVQKLVSLILYIGHSGKQV